MGTQAPTMSGYQTVQDTADQLGMKPYDVLRLIKSGELTGLVLVETASLEVLKEKS